MPEKANLVREVARSAMAQSAEVKAKLAAYVAANAEVEAMHPVEKRTGDVEPWQLIPR